MPELESAAPAAILAWALQTYGREFAIATSFQKEGMVLIDLAARIDPGVRVFTLDTGRLPQETHEMIDTVRRRYGIAVEVVLPDPAEVASMVAAHGANLFYDSVEFRRLCCEVRKVRPLDRYLSQLKAWAGGLRREQQETRAAIRKIEEAGGRLKLSPIADWLAGQVDQYIREHNVPLHPLFSRGYTSIGCAPCTRAVAPGESERAGRWWWEEGAAKECGIHFTPEGTIRRNHA